MGGELERYQQELDTVYKPINARFVHYQKVMFEIRSLLRDYFFNAKRLQKLREPAKENEMVFDFNQIKGAMEVCLVDESFIDNMISTDYSSLITAFDSQIANCGLPIEIQKEQGLYVFNPPKAYTPMAQVFMQQFTYALGVYRLSLGIYEIYSYILSHPQVQQIHGFQNYINSAQSLKELLKKENVDLIALHRHTKALKKEILGELKSEKIYNGINIFDSDLDKFTSQLSELLEFGAGYLENCYKVFPNDPILWMLHDRSWHSLIKNLSNLLYANYYTYSTLYSTLEIKKEFIALIKNELQQFDIISSEKMALLKIELLREAAKLISELKIDLLAKLAEQGIELNEAPAFGLFANSSSRPSIYQLMADFYRESRYPSVGANMQSNI
ncbi:hypothetical protein ACQUW5_06035 [Legionella sp. CNM-1927-20]|uniref:hypothetical protein n=1 Tax=Legionella sp. CNM-1927-20 TaxID=3422221 RepID=UPI00403AC37E